MNCYMACSNQQKFSLNMSLNYSVIFHPKVLIYTSQLATIANLITVFIIKEHIYFSCTMAILSYSSCTWMILNASFMFYKGKNKKGYFLRSFFRYETHIITIYGMSVLSMTINFISTYFPLQHSNPNGQHRWHS